MIAHPTLPAITALARAGAVMRGWELFEAAGYLEQGDDPAALAVKGRLLKGRARIAPTDRRAALFAEAAAAYAAAHALGPAPYLAINVATLSLLAGEPDKAAERAREVLALLDDTAAPAADTPYFLAATRAEALLILGQGEAAEAAMEQAAAADPDGWLDRAATVAQLREIAAAQSIAQPWIERFAPPASLHFAGHMGIAAGGASEAMLAGQLDALFAGQRIGSAWGALAAGADIVIAERLLERGVALHAVLPCPPALFAAQSVAPAGPAWEARFHAALERAASIEIAAEFSSSVHDPVATLHAGELAIGGALNSAATFASSACQLLVLDPDGGGENTRRQEQLWREGAGAQHRLTVPRDCAVEALFPPEKPDPARIQAVHLAIGLEGLDQIAKLPTEQIVAFTARVSAALAGLPRGAVRVAPFGWEAVIDDITRARRAIARLAVLGSAAVGAHLAIGPVLRDAATGTLVPYGPAPELARHLMRLAPSGVALASNALAVTLAARGFTGLRSELYHAGDAEAGGAIHALLAV